MTTNLNLDVLAVVCKFLTRISDVLAFSLTCSALRPIAVQHLLSIYTIPLTSSASIRRFHRFLFADVHARALHVRSIRVGSQTLRPQIGDQPGDESLLLDVLKSCPHLEHFSLSSENTTYQPRNDWNSHAVNDAAARKNPRNWVGEPMDMFILLQAVRAPLRMLSIDILNPRGDKWDPATLKKFLPRFAPTLQKLELRNLFLYPDGTWGLDVLGLLGLASTMTQYHAVRSLTIRSLEGMPFVGFPQHLFLALNGTLHIYESGLTDFPGTNEHMHIVNQSVQNRRPDKA